MIGDQSGGRVRVHWEDDTYSTERRSHLVMIGAALTPVDPERHHPVKAAVVIVLVLAALVIASGAMIIYGSPR